MEIERKFLIPDVYVKELFERDAERLEIEQYYVTVGTTEERYRRINGDCFYKGELSGLAVCEVEFDDENQAKEFLPPYFFGKEITGDARYRNRNLALNGLPDT